ncbi:MAG: holo-ACP synthase [Thermoanaerobaculia bacterium]
MSVTGIGVDLVAVARIEAALERHGRRFVERVCCASETVSGSPGPQRLAGLFAAKEAVLKALGTGWAEGLAFHQIEVARDDRGAPGVRLHGVASRRAEALGVTRIHLSISHDGGMAVAVAVLESGPPQRLH